MTMNCTPVDVRYQSLEAIMIWFDFITCQTSQQQKR